MRPWPPGTRCGTFMAGGLVMLAYRGILTGLTKSTDHPSRRICAHGLQAPHTLRHVHGRGSEAGVVLLSCGSQPITTVKARNPFVLYVPIVKPTEPCMELLKAFKNEVLDLVGLHETNRTPAILVAQNICPLSTRS